jgi:DNA-binding MarR family transcriptional regulator
MPSSTRRAAGLPPAALPEGSAAFVRDTCVCLHLQRAARAVGRRFDEALRPLGLTHEQFSLLMSLAGGAPPGIGALAAELVLDRTTLSANLKPLQRRGLLQVLPDPADGRGRLVALTPGGQQLLAEALPLWQAVQERTAASHPGLDWPPVRQGLRTLAA